MSTELQLNAAKDVPLVLSCSQIQICKEINKAANILADFIQDTAGVCASLSLCDHLSTLLCWESWVLTNTLADQSHPPVAPSYRDEKDPTSRPMRAFPRS